MNGKLCWNCDFCGKPDIIVSLAGTLYCNNCRMSYGENIKPTKEGICGFPKFASI